MLFYRLSPALRRGFYAVLVTATVGACTGDAGRLIELADAGEARGFVKPAGSREAIVDSTPRGTLDSRDLTQRVLVRPRPPKIIAQDFNELPDALTFAQRAATGDKARVRGARWTEAAQIGLLFGSPEGKAFLAGKSGGRALVRGEPMESCPVLNVALATTDDEATSGAMRACLNETAALPDCGCRLIARGSHLLAPRDDFAYAIGVGTTVIDNQAGSIMTYASEERMVEGRPGARHIWLLGIDGPAGLLQVEADGRAAMTLNATGERFDGTHKADGFRRGRVARRAYLSGPGGRSLIVLVGYEDTEFKENRMQLSAWNPYGSPLLKKAEAE